jgi:hypothetical protein
MVLFAVLALMTGAPALPDLAVTEFGWIPAHPRVGDHVRFHATVKNVGRGATPEGQLIGVAFCIGTGNPRFWSDTYRHSLKPGQTVRLEANGGADGSPDWIATGGDQPYGVYANVNDARRFPESSWLNNIVVKDIHVIGRGPRPSTMRSGKPDLIVTNFVWSPRRPRFGDGVTIRVTVENIGPAATPADKPLGVGFYTTYLDTAVLYSSVKGRSLQPGASITLTTNGGTHGFPWIAFPGRHAIVAKVNDVGQIDEADIENNYFRRVMEVSDPRTRRFHGYVRLHGTVFGDQTPAEPPWTARERAFDGDEDTGSISSSLGPVPLGVALQRPRRVDLIAFYPKPYSESQMVGGRFQGSNVAADRGYEDLAIVVSKPKMGWNFLAPGRRGPYRYVRYLAPAKGQGIVHEIAFLARWRSGSR